jgi:monovalent cation/proton antiporter MnhG/PhaG subunit
MSARHVVIDVFLILGVALVLISCLGVIAFRQVHDRLHFSGPAVLGAVCITVAVMVKESFSLVGDKTILIAIFLLVVGPIVTHAIGRASRTAQHGDWRLQPTEKIEVEQEGR